MSKKQWMVLLMLFLTYLLLGASIFYHIESRLEVEKVKKAIEERIEINALLNQHYITSNPAADHHEILQKLSNYCGKSFHNYTEGETSPLKWDFYNSFSFAYTVVSTIGYGNLAPTNMLGRILMIFYGLIGIPMNGILLTQLGEFFGQVFVKAHKKYKSYQQDQNDCQKKHNPLETRKAGLAMQIFMYLIPGFVMFIFFPAFLFSHYEGWTYDEAVYYAFVTLTTIGFGDYVAGQDNSKGSGVFFILYKTFLICWISFGLGYIVMIMTFIARGMRSKKIARIEHKLAMNLKHTQSKIWNEFNKEVSYFRRVFNELQLSKVKRVYVDEYDYDPPTPKFARSNSFPDLRELIYGGLEIPEPPCPRRRANSEVVPMVRVARVVSETDLQRIDRKATFATHAMVQPAELLARLVNILGYIPPPDDEEETETKEGIQGFSDKEILSSEVPWSDSEWRLGGDKISRPKPRSRACSEIRLENPDSSYLQENGEWTWSGPAASSKIQEIIKSRRSAVRDFKSKFPSIALPKSVQKSFLPRWMRNLSNKRSSEDHTRSTVSVGEIDERDREALQSQMIRNHSSRISTNRAYFTHTGAGNTGLEGLLEETSLADFIRALTRVGAPEDFSKKLSRKMGTASLTPPKLPSLFTLFSQHPEFSSTSQSQQNTITAAQNAASRRFSLRTVENSSTSTPVYSRRSVAQLPPVTKGRRFSLRPVVTPAGGTPQYSPYLGNEAEPPPYTNESFNVECPKEPLMHSEGAPGVSAPISTTGTRRFSLRPAQIDNPSLPSTTSVPLNQQPTQTRVLPRWKAGMLQRQISKKNLQRRVRAFSLSDVYSDITDRNTGISPLAFDKSRTVTTLVGKKDYPYKLSSRATTSSIQKTVTIVSPPHEASSSRASDSKQGSSFKRGYSESEAEPETSSLRSQGPGSTPETSWDNASQFYKEPSSESNPFDEFSKFSPGSQAMNKNPFSFKLGSDDYETSTSGKSKEGVVNPRFATLKTYPSSLGVTKLATVYSDDRLSSQDTDQSDDSFTSECVIALKKKSAANLPELDTKVKGRQPSPTEKEPTKKEPSGEDSKPGQPSDFTKLQSTVSRKSESALSAKSVGEKTDERKVSIVSIEPWTESSRRTSISSQTHTGESRKSAEVKSPNLLEVKVEKSASSSDKFKATIEVAVNDEGSLMEVKVDKPKASASSESAAKKYSPE